MTVWFLATFYLKGKTFFLFANFSALYQGVPIEKEHTGPAHQRPKILGGEIVNNSAPGKPAHRGQGHSYGGVEVPPGHSAAYHHPEEYTDCPPQRKVIILVVGVNR